ncbi:starvation-inducible outer membrane lipoprotein [Vibrio sinaloensis DSM 21326]|uniref:Starvation-inducible outer membrane lipoprotein n=1 Tax=Vibrio sinaloensis DSM 21326 TaxID=945550 RepID=E8MBI0_PHOS4|nr:starvation-inducible outer membrane lipoprotein [Vibrio sinaloensis DSM 21326]
MMTFNPSFKLLALPLLLILSACSSLPEELKSDNPQLVTEYETWKSDKTGDYSVRLGGVIAKVTNLENSTRVEVVNLPISKSGKPDINQEPDGRFIGYIQGFADPVKLSEGRLITLLGEGIEPENGKVGEFDYSFPVMKVEGFYLWRIEETVRMHDVDSYMYPCRSLYCRDIRYGTRQGKVIQEVK